MNFPIIVCRLRRSKSATPQAANANLTKEGQP